MERRMRLVRSSDLTMKYLDCASPVEMLLTMLQILTASYPILWSLSHFRFYRFAISSFICTVFLIDDRSRRASAVLLPRAHAQQGVE